MSVGSVQGKAESPFSVRRELIADRSSLTCAALTMVVCTSRGLSVKLPETLAEKLAVTERATLMVTEQEAAVPVHAPVQPLKVEPAAGVAVNVTAVPLV